MGGVAVFYGLSVTLDAVSKIVVAVITGAFGIATAVVTHALTVQRERDAEQLRRKQERYAQILERLSPYIRNRGDPTDGFATAVLHAYVVGAPAVAAGIRDFMSSRDGKTLDRVIAAMRTDLGMEPLAMETSIQGLLPAGIPPGTV